MKTQTTSFTLTWDKNESNIPNVVLICLDEPPKKVIMQCWENTGAVQTVTHCFKHTWQAYLFIEWLNTWFDPIAAKVYFSSRRNTPNLIIGHISKYLYDCTYEPSMLYLYYEARRVTELLTKS